VDVQGQLWWGGLTASLAVTNTSDQILENWGVEFISDHRFSGEAWGVNVNSQMREGGGYRYEISGADWGQSIAPGQTIDVGFNALTGITDNVNIPLTEQLLLAEGSITVL
jgi:endoglucanase